MWWLKKRERIKLSTITISESQLAAFVYIAKRFKETGEREYTLGSGMKIIITEEE